MTLTTLNSKNLEEQLLTLVPYNVYYQKFPKRLDSGLRNRLAVLQKMIQPNKRSSVSTVIVTEMTKDEVTMYAFGSFRRPYSAKKQLAEALAPFCMETLMLPIVKPILAKDWQVQSQKRGQIYTEVQTQGILVFSKNDLTQESKAKLCHMTDKASLWTPELSPKYIWRLIYETNYLI